MAVGLECEPANELRTNTTSRLGCNTTPPSAKFPSTVAWLAAASAILCSLAFLGFHQSFSSYAGYDDEGYLLLSLRSFMKGQPLYEKVFTQYGPSFYFLNQLWHNVTGMPVTTDMGRFKTLSLWLATTAIAAWTVVRLTQNRWLALASLPLVFLHYDRLGFEPAHPQDLCLLLIAASLLVASYVKLDKPQLSLAVVLGILSGVLVTTKLNLGVLLGIGTVMTVLVITEASWQRHLTLLFLAAAVIGLPWWMSRSFVTVQQGWQLPTATTVGMIGLLIAGWHGGSQRLPWKWTAGYIFSSATTAGAFLLLTMLNGTSWASLRYGMLDQHVQFLQHCFVFAPLESWMVLLASTSIPLVILSKSNSTSGRLLLAGALALLAATCAIQYLESTLAIGHGMQPRGAAALLMSVVAPMAWLALLPILQKNTHDADNSSLFPRVLLAFTAVTEIQSAMPVPGTQMAIGTYAALLLLIVLTSDLLKFFAEFRWTVGAERVVVLGVLLISLSTVVVRCEYHRRVFNSRVPLDLPGAARLRFPAEDAAKIRSAVAALRQRADTFVTLPTGLNSLYLWSEIEPPTGFNTTLWDRLLSDSQQQAVVKKMQQSARPRLLWLVTEPYPLHRGTLVNYLLENYTECEEAGSFALLAPKK